MFHPLTKSEINNIAKLQLKQLNDFLLKNGINIHVTDRPVDYITNEGYDPLHGTSYIKRIIQREILNKLSEIIISRELNTQKFIRIDCLGNHLYYSNDQAGNTL